MLSKSFPHSPDLENIPNGFCKMGALFERNSPLSALSHEFDSSLLISAELESKTPRRSLISQLALASATPGSSMKETMKDLKMICDSPFNSSPKTQKNLANGEILQKIVLPKFSLSSPFTHEADLVSDNVAGLQSAGSIDSDQGSLLSLCSSDDQDYDSGVVHMEDNSTLGSSSTLLDQTESENPFVPSDVAPASALGKDPAILFKTSLKFRDQNQSKLLPGKAWNGNRYESPDFRLSHWNQRGPMAKPHAFTKHKTITLLKTKKREIEFQSPELQSLTMFGSGRVACPSHPPRKIRRSLTFNGEAKTQSIQVESGESIDAFTPHSPLLPSFLETGKDMIRRINSSTLLNLLDGEYVSSTDKVYLIDCRYPFEYHGGHIKGAINITATETIENMFFHSRQSTSSKSIIIFHCEYSCQRAPKMFVYFIYIRALYFRGLDRNQNKDVYPRLDYPDIYILQGGYRDFYYENKLHCEPQGYIEMNDVKYENECKQGIMLQKKQFPNFSKDGFLR